MSFNPHHNNLAPISLDNYEEYFVLYADKELGDADRFSVEQFIVLHPDLKQELDLFLTAKLPLEQINLDDKETLFAHSMKLNAIDEALLLYVDNELSAEEKISVEEKLKTDKTYQLQYEGLLQTKPSAHEPIVYPYKKDLYRYEEKRRASFYWVRIAAALIILLGMGAVVFNYQDKPDSIVARDIEKTQPEKEAPATQPATTGVAIKEKGREPVEPTVVKVGEPDDATNVVRNLKKVPQQNKKNKQIVVAPQEGTEQIMASNEVKKPEQKNEVERNKEDVVLEKEKNSSQQTLNNNIVTTPPIASFNHQTTSLVSAVTSDVVKTGNEKKSSLKGFLRKATRFIERRTNISTTDDNDELLIGFAALKL